MSYQLFFPDDCLNNIWRQSATKCHIHASYVRVCDKYHILMNWLVSFFEPPFENFVNKAYVERLQQTPLLAYLAMLDVHILGRVTIKIHTLYLQAPMTA